MLSENVDCMIAIVGGEVRGAAAIYGFRDYEKTIAKWSADSRVSEIVRVPVEVARAFLFQRWPGREAALAALTTPDQGERDGHG